MIIKREIGEKGQIVIPKDIREYLGLDFGVNITFEVKDNEVIIRKEKSPIEIVEDFFNIPKLKKKVSIKEIKEKYEEEYG